MTNIDASDLTSGSVPDARLTTNVALLGTAQTFTGLKQFAPAGNVPFTVDAAKTNMVAGLNAEFVGGKRRADLATAVHNHSYDDITSGTINDGFLSANVAKLDIAQTITGSYTFSPGASAAPFGVAAGKTATVGNLSADLLDGYHASALLRLAENTTVTGATAFSPTSGTVPFTVGAGKTNQVGNLNAEYVGGKRAADLALAGHTHFGVAWAGATATGLEVSTTATNGTAISGISSADTGTTWGLSGEAQSSEGRGVAGRASSDTGQNYGGKFSASGDAARAVYGEADNAGNCVNYGGKFAAAGQAGYGLYAEATSPSNNVNYGGMFLAKGQRGVGVRGIADSSAATTNYGGYFTAAGQAGVGVYASGSDKAVQAFSSRSGSTTVYALNSGHNSTGVQARAGDGSLNDASYGGYFEAIGAKGIGAYAANTYVDSSVALAGPGYAVRAEGNVVVTNGSVIVTNGDLVLNGALRGNINGGAPFPRPGYDSGWTRILQDSWISFYLPPELQGEPDDIVVDIRGRDANGSINNFGLGGTVVTSGDRQGAFYFLYRGSTTHSNLVDVYRQPEDDFWPYVRVRAWVIK